MKTCYQDPATNRQLKALKFFGFATDDKITKGVASRIIVDLFSRGDNRALWEKYIFITGDQGQESPDLQLFDSAELENTIIPPDWKPRTSKIKKKTGFERERLMEMAAAMLKEGVPFDDPIPTVEYAGKHFCFTGKFQYGSRTCYNDMIVRFVWAAFPMKTSRSIPTTSS